MSSIDSCACFCSCLSVEGIFFFLFQLACGYLCTFQGHHLHGIAQISKVDILPICGMQHGRLPILCAALFLSDFEIMSGHNVEKKEADNK
jgi:hypothetical protein